MNNLINKVINIGTIVFEALIKSYIYFFILKIAFNIFSIPLNILLPNELIRYFFELYSSVGLKLIFFIELTSIILNKSNKKISFRKYFSKKELSITGINKEYIGKSKKLDEKINKIIQLNKVYRKYIIEKLNPNEILYSKSASLLENINSSFNKDLNSCVKCIEIIEINGVQSEESKTTLDMLNKYYDEIDKKSSKLLELVNRFELDIKNNSKDDKYLYEDLEKMMNLIKKI